MKYLLIIIATYLLNVVMCWITGDMSFFEVMFSKEVFLVMLFTGWVPVALYNMSKNYENSK